jgi:hypothetical protein
LQGVKDPRGPGWHDCLAFGEDFGAVSHPSEEAPIEQARQAFSIPEIKELSLRCWAKHDLTGVRQTVDPIPLKLAKYEIVETSPKPTDVTTMDVHGPTKTITADPRWGKAELLSILQGLDIEVRTAQCERPAEFAIRGDWPYTLVQVEPERPRSVTVRVRGPSRTEAEILMHTGCGRDRVRRQTARTVNEAGNP